MHIAVCDDNLDELTRISSLLEAYPKCHLITYETFFSAIELLETMKLRNFDLLILDILMPGITGMDAAKEIRQNNNEVPIIFLTSSREFAVESYRVGAKDYIMKPVQKEEIFPALDKQLAQLTRESAYLTLKTGTGIIKLPFLHIEYVEVINRTVHFIQTNGEVREVYGYLADYEGELLSDPYFYKPHRSYIVNFRQVSELDKKGFYTITGKTVPIARDAYTKAKAAYMKFLLSSTERSDLPC